MYQTQSYFNTHFYVTSQGWAFYNEYVGTTNFQGKAVNNYFQNKNLINNKTAYI